MYSIAWAFTKKYSQSVIVSYHKMCIDFHKLYAYKLEDVHVLTIFK